MPKRSFSDGMIPAFCHLVFVIKPHHRVLNEYAIQRLGATFGEGHIDFEAQWIEMDGKDGHVPMESPKVAVPLCVNSIKGVYQADAAQEAPVQKLDWMGG